MSLISAVIITNNVQEHIKKTVTALKWCDEIIIIDSGSNDKTVEICSSLGCNVIVNEFKGYGDQKNFGVSLAKNDWILSIDSDEIVSDNLADEIQYIINNTSIEYCGFQIPITLVFLNHVFKHYENKKLHLRLYNKKFAKWNDAEVHEKVITDGKIGQLNNEILHYSYSDISHYISKMNLYTSRGAVLLDKKGKNVNFFKLFFKFPIDFFVYYFIRKSFLEGKVGFIWAILCCFYPMVKYFKLFEKNIEKQC